MEALFVVSRNDVVSFLVAEEIIVVVVVDRQSEDEMFHLFHFPLNLPPLGFC